MLRIDVRSSRELQAVILSIRQANKTVQAEIRRHTKPMVQTEWRSALAQESLTRFENRVLVDTARVAVSNQNVKLKAGGLARRLRGGGRVRELAAQAEFGAGLSWATTRSRKGREYQRRSGDQFRPYNKSGYVAYPAAARIIPRLAALWVQTAVRTMHEAFERKTR